MAMGKVVNFQTAKKRVKQGKKIYSKNSKNSTKHSYKVLITIFIFIFIMTSFVTYIK